MSFFIVFILQYSLLAAALNHHNNWDTSLFSLLLKTPRGLVLPPKATLDIPISYAPDTMQKHEAICTVVTQKCQNDAAQQTPDDKLTWTYNLQGIPTSMPLKSHQVPVIKCRCRERLEEKMEISFADVNVSTAQTNLLKSVASIRLLGKFQFDIKF